MSLAHLPPGLPFFPGGCFSADLAACSSLAILAIIETYLDEDLLEFEGGDKVKLTSNKGLTSQLFLSWCRTAGREFHIPNAYLLWMPLGIRVS